MSIFQESSQSPTIVRRGRHHWEATKSFLVLNSSAQGFENHIWNTALAERNSRHPPRCRRIASTRNFLPGLTLARAYFRTMREPGIVRVAMAVRATTEEMMLDTDGKYVNSFDYAEWKKDNSHVYWWRPVAGTPKRYVGNILIRLQTAVSRLSAARVRSMAAKVGTVNGTAMARLGVDAGTLLCMGPELTYFEVFDDIVFVNWTFLYNPNGHNADLACRRFMRVAVEVPVSNIAGEIATTHTRHMLTWLPVELNADDEYEDSKIEARKGYLKASFSNLDRQIKYD